MIVSGITPADKRRSRVYLDGSFAFVLYNGEIKRFHIEEGEELAQELYSQIMDEVLCRRARERMLHLLKSTSRTELEIRRKAGGGPLSPAGYRQGRGVCKAVPLYRRR